VKKGYPIDNPYKNRILMEFTFFERLNQKRLSLFWDRIMRTGPYLLHTIHKFCYHLKKKKERFIVKRRKNRVYDIVSMEEVPEVVDFKWDSICLLKIVAYVT
jgi:hypothetical protein